MLCGVKYRLLLSVAEWWMTETASLRTALCNSSFFLFSPTLPKPLSALFLHCAIKWRLVPRSISHASHEYLCVLSKTAPKTWHRKADSPGHMITSGPNRLTFRLSCRRKAPVTEPTPLELYKRRILLNYYYDITDKWNTVNQSWCFSYACISTPQLGYL